MWILARTSRPSLPRSRVLLGRCRDGYVHVPKKKPPHLLGPAFVWRKCFVVHPRVQIQDPLTKYQWLTKSVLIKDLPECIKSQGPPSESVIKDFEERACEYLAFQKREDYMDSNAVSGLLQSVLASVWQLADEYPHIRGSHLAFNPHVEAYWRRNDENYISQTQPLYIMHCNVGLGLLCDSTYVGEGLPPVQYTPRHLGLFKRSFDQIDPFCGTQRFSPFTLAHTIFMANCKYNSPEGLYTHGLIQLFSQSVAGAVQNKFKLDRDLPYPLVTQGIITNGKQFTFVCFQLNTLDLQESPESGKCNVFWAGPSLDLFESVAAGEGVEGFNTSCAELIVKFLVHRPVRRRLRQWGGRSKAMAKSRLDTEGLQLSPMGNQPLWPSTLGHDK